MESGTRWPPLPVTSIHEAESPGTGATPSWIQKTGSSTVDVRAPAWTRKETRRTTAPYVGSSSTASIEYGWTASVESVDAAFAQGLTMTIGLPSPSDLGGVT